MRAIASRPGGAFLVVLALSACGGSDGGADRIRASSTPTATPAVLPPADYLTQSDHFAELQRAALASDYEGFADHLGAGDPQAVVGQLRDAFGGGPFDLYTLDDETGSRGHRRVAELRGPSGRLYLYLELDRADGGWIIDRYELSRDRATSLARL